MSDSHIPCLIGVDGGGTSCRFALVRGDTRVEHTLGAANASTDRAATIATLRQGLAALAEAAGLGPQDIALARGHFGLAGVMTPRDGVEIADEMPLTALRVTDDRPTTLAGALGPRDGTIAALGTGSFFARRTGGRTRAIGGWGLTLGDEASGAWLGRGLLSATLHAVDGMRAHSDLTRSTLARFHEDPAGIEAFARGASPSGFAGLARGIVAAAEVGDATALDLMRAGADAVQRAALALDWAPDEALCLTGGIGPAYGPYLPAHMAACVIPAAGTALDGALQLAAEVPAPEGVR